MLITNFEMTNNKASFKVSNDGGEEVTILVNSHTLDELQDCNLLDLHLGGFNDEEIRSLILIVSGLSNILNLNSNR